MDQAREALRQHGLVAQAPFLHAARLEVLDQNIGVLQQPEQHLPACLLGQIEANALLVAVDPDEVAGIARLIEWRAPFARLVALRRLQLDHLGSVIGQYHRAVRASEHAREIDHFEPSQRTGASRQGFAPGQRRKIVHGALFLPNTRAASASLSSISSQTAPRNSASRFRSTPLLPPPAAPGSPEPSRILGHHRLAGLAIAALRELASRQGGRADREIRLTL